MQVRTALKTLALAALGGCTTHLESGRIAESGVTHGIVYNLPKIYYDVEVKRTLSQCPLPPDSQNPNPVGRIAFDITATATSRTVAGEEVAIDYTALANFMKISDFALERYPSGILKSVNVTVDDRTADVIAEGFKAVVSVAKISIGLPGGGGVAAGPVPVVNNYLACTPGAAEALDALPALRKAVRDAEAGLKKVTKEHGDYVAEHPEAKPTPAVVTKISDLIRGKREKQEALDVANKTVSEAVAKITLISRFSYEPGDPAAHRVDGVADGNAEATKPEAVIELRSREVDAKGKSRWLAHILTDRLKLDVNMAASAYFVGEDKTMSADTREEAISLAQAYWTGAGRARRDTLASLLEPLSDAEVHIVAGSTGRAPLAGNLPNARTCGDKDRPRCGILYRTEVPGRLRVCRGNASGMPEDAMCLGLSAKDERVLLADERSIPQFGALASLEFTNRPFSNNMLTAEFNEQGSLIKFAYKKPRAEAVAIGQSINTGLDATSQIITYANGKELRQANDDKALNDARAAALTSALPLQQPSDQTKVENETKYIDAQTKKLEAEINRRKKQQELDALTAGASESDQ